MHVRNWKSEWMTGILRFEIMTESHIAEFIRKAHYCKINVSYKFSLSSSSLPSPWALPLSALELTSTNRFHSYGIHRSPLIQADSGTKAGWWGIRAYSQLTGEWGIENSRWMTRFSSSFPTGNKKKEKKTGDAGSSGYGRTQRAHAWCHQRLLSGDELVQPMNAAGAQTRWRWSHIIASTASNLESSKLRWPSALWSRNLQWLRTLLITGSSSRNTSQRHVLHHNPCDWRHYAY